MINQPYTPFTVTTNTTFPQQVQKRLSGLNFAAARCRLGAEAATECNAHRWGCSEPTRCYAAIPKLLKHKKAEMIARAPCSALTGQARAGSPVTVQSVLRTNSTEKLGGREVESGKK